jgi:predicted amidohydrolase YtcJ
MRASIPVALGSDWRDVEHDDLRECDPLLGMYVAVERRAPGADEPWAPDEAIDVAQALHGYTVGGAVAGRQEHRRGCLRVGHDADITVLSEDIVAGGAKSLLRARVLLTLVAGRTAFAEDGKCDH